MISEGDRYNVTDSWGHVYCQWVSVNGLAFYTRLFRKYPLIRSTFAKFGTVSDPEVRKQGLLFGKMVNLWLENINNKEALTVKIKEVCSKHTARGITDPALYQTFLDELVSFIADIIGLTPAQRASWDNVICFIMQQIKLYL